MNRDEKKFTWFMIGVAVVVAGYIILLVSMSNHPPTTITKTTRAVHQWAKTDSLAYAHDQIFKNAEAQFSCLSNLWGKESAWNPKAHNKTLVMGKKAGGIPQLLGMNPLTPPTEQIERGLVYIYYRYTTPCGAWYHWQRLGWY